CRPPAASRWRRASIAACSAGSGSQATNDARESRSWRSASPRWSSIGRVPDNVTPSSPSALGIVRGRIHSLRFVGLPVDDEDRGSRTIDHHGPDLRTCPLAVLTSASTEYLGRG